MIIRTVPVLFLLCASTGLANANTFTCGLKTVTVSGNTITKIVHEDGTVHTGGSVAKNWNYDGKSITHNLIKDPISCGNKEKSRAEVIAELSSALSKNPKSYGMTPNEANLMVKYTTKLMNEDQSCHLLVDAGKSTQRKGMFYIDCNDKRANTRRFWISENDLAGGSLKGPRTPISIGEATLVCNKELKARTTNPGTYDPSLVLGTSSTAIERTGRNIVEIYFEAKNSFGVVGKYVGNCILESGVPIEVMIRNK